MPKSTIATVAYNAATNENVWTFKNGETRTSPVDGDCYSATIRRNFAAQGNRKKLVDSYATANGDVNLAVSMWDRVNEQLCGGTWNASGRGGSVSMDSQHAEAVIRYVAQERGVKPSEIRADIVRLDKLEEKISEGYFRGNKHVRALEAKVRAERAAKQVKNDTDEKADLSFLD